MASLIKNGKSQFESRRYETTMVYIGTFPITVQKALVSLMLFILRHSLFYLFIPFLRAREWTNLKTINQFKLDFK